MVVGVLKKGKREREKKIVGKGTFYDYLLSSQKNSLRNGVLERTMV